MSESSLSNANDSCSDKPDELTLKATKPLPAGESIASPLKGNPPSIGMYLVITNISKTRNVKSLLLTAAAFGCKAVLVVGQPSFDFDPSGRDIPGKIKLHVAEGHLPIQRFEQWKDCVSYLKERRIRLVGVEIHDDSKLIDEFFDATQSIAFVMGNEGQGLNAKQMDSCDDFVRIPQYGGGTASLNVYVAAGIVLHRYYDFLTEQQRTSRSPS